MADRLPEFRQTESDKPGWVWPLVLAVAVGAGVVIFATRTTPPRGAERWVAVPIALLACAMPIVLLLVVRIDYEVHADGIRVRWVPFVNRYIRFEDISRVEVATYRPIREYGGWGIRGWGNKTAYSLSGNRGVLLTLSDGRTVMLGSADPEPLATALTSRMQRS